MPLSTDGEVRRRLLALVDDAIAVYRETVDEGTSISDRRYIARLTHALYDLSQAIEGFLLYGEPNEDDPFTDDGVDMLAKRPPETREETAQRRRRSMRRV